MINRHRKKTLGIMALVAAIFVTGNAQAQIPDDMLPRGDAYMTAWMHYWLCDDAEAGKCFIGSDAEILNNESWQDVSRKNL